MNLWKDDWTPMLLSEMEKMISSKNYLYEIKFDGIRAILFVTQNQVMIKNRNGKDITKKFPELQEVKKIAKKKMIFDGEIVCFFNRRPNFSKVMQRIHSKGVNQTNPIIYMAFDLLYDGKDITNLPLKNRKEYLKQYEDLEYFVKVKSFSNGNKLFQQTKRLKLEGIVAKEKNSIYEPNCRSTNWIKMKHQKEGIFYIGGYQEKENNAVVSLLLGELQSKKLKYVGKVTMAKKNPFYTKIKKMKKKRKNPFDKKIEDSYFIKPTIQCSVKYLERTTSNALRHPIFQKIVEKKE